jgi:hypothetical protein
MVLLCDYNDNHLHHLHHGPRQHLSLQIHRHRLYLLSREIQHLLSFLVLHRLFRLHQQLEEHLRLRSDRLH